MERSYPFKVSLRFDQYSTDSFLIYSALILIFKAQEMHMKSLEQTNTRISPEQTNTRISLGLLYILSAPAIIICLGSAACVLLGGPVTASTIITGMINGLLATFNLTGLLLTLPAWPMMTYAAIFGASLLLCTLSMPMILRLHKKLKTLGRIDLRDSEEKAKLKFNSEPEWLQTQVKLSYRKHDLRVAQCRLEVIKAKKQKDQSLLSKFAWLFLFVKAGKWALNSGRSTMSFIQRICGILTLSLIPASLIYTNLKLLTNTIDPIHYRLGKMVLSLSVASTLGIFAFYMPLLLGLSTTGTLPLIMQVASALIACTVATYFTKNQLLRPREWNTPSLIWTGQESLASMINEPDKAEADIQTKRAYYNELWRTTWPGKIHHATQRVLQTALFSIGAAVAGISLACAVMGPAQFMHQAVLTLSSMLSSIGLSLPPVMASVTLPALPPLLYLAVAVIACALMTKIVYDVSTDSNATVDPPSNLEGACTYAGTTTKAVPAYPAKPVGSNQTANNMPYVGKTG